MLRLDRVCRDAHAEDDDSVEARPVAEPVAAEADGVPFAVVVARYLAHVVVQLLVQRDERARGLGHDRRLDGDRHSIPDAVRVHLGDRQARTLLSELRPVIALGMCELVLGSPPHFLGALRKALSRLVALYRGVERRLLHLS